MTNSGRSLVPRTQGYSGWCITAAEWQLLHFQLVIAYSGDILNHVTTHCLSYRGDNSDLPWQLHPLYCIEFISITDHKHWNIWRSHGTLHRNFCHKDCTHLYWYLYCTNCEYYQANTNTSPTCMCWEIIDHYIFTEWDIVEVDISMHEVLSTQAAFRPPLPSVVNHALHAAKSEVLTSCML